MAYPTVDKPYGLKPVNLIGGQVFAGATRQMEIASGYATNTFFMAIWSSVFLTERLKKTQEQPLPRLAVCFGC
jgi:hypothetical protein